ncbi:chemotaxis protein CheD [Vibrio sp.]|uniref:chemotaxis protein CheD n=1 Tax=Vibrio sp. TaxID=678 RepID=UPI003D14A379
MAAIETHDLKATEFKRFYHSRRGVHIVKVPPGGVYCSRENELICTGLGSCISACMWDADKKVGGINHFLLPFSSVAQLRHWHADELLSTASRYGSHAMEMLINELIKLGAEREKLQVKLFGGAQMLGYKSLIGEKNIEFILSYLQQEGFDIVAMDLGGEHPRKIMFNPTNGRVWLKRIPFNEVTKLRHQEERYAHQLDEESHKQHDSDVELF